MPKTLLSSVVFFCCTIFCLVLSFILFYLVFRYFLPLKPKYPHQHPILKHPQPMFLPQCERTRFTLTHNYRQNYNSVYLNLYIFGQQTGRRKICYTVIPSNIILTHILPPFFRNIPNLQVIWFIGCLLAKKKNMHIFSASSFYITTL